MDNPVPYTGRFKTPENLTELIEHCCDLHESQRSAALNAVFLAMNLSHKLVKQEIEKNELYRYR